MGNPPGFGPEQNPEVTHDGAPAGPWPSDAELPINPVPGGNPASLTGRPDGTNTESQPQDAMNPYPARPLGSGRR
jgi:hypothetical protein